MSQNYKDAAAVLAELMERDPRIRGNGQELARRTKVPQANIARVLSGATREPREATLEPLAKFFGCSVAQMRGHEPMDWEAGVSEPGEIISQEGRDMLSLYFSLSPDMRGVIMRLVERVAAETAQGVDLTAVTSAHEAPADRQHIVRRPIRATPGKRKPKRDTPG